MLAGGAYLLVGTVTAVAQQVGFAPPQWLTLILTAPLALLAGGALLGPQGLLIGVLWCGLIFGTLYLISLFAVLLLTGASIRIEGDPYRGVHGNRLRRIATYAAIAIGLAIVLLAVLAPLLAAAAH